jgi:glycosyltransferase involved in cell wall biosynthesis
VVTTPVGARGYELVDDRHAVVCPLEDFARYLRALLDDEARAERLAAEGRRLAERRYDWGAVAAGVVAALERVLADTERPECRGFAGG